ncbi:hypothetical protein MKW98_019236, partial [Papaver atlanticum]
ERGYLPKIFVGRGHNEKRTSIHLRLLIGLNNDSNKDFCSDNSPKRSWAVVECPEGFNFVTLIPFLKLSFRIQFLLCTLCNP